MPPKRPAPLSDAYIQPAARAAASTVLGESVPLPVKNTFIDVPSGLTPAAMKSASGDRTLSLSTAPPNLDSQPLFQQALLSALQSSAAATPSNKTAEKRTISKIQATPLQTPSPTHAARVSSYWASIAAGSSQPASVTLSGASFATMAEHSLGATFTYPTPVPAVSRVVPSAPYQFPLSTSPPHQDFQWAPEALLPPMVNSFPVSTGATPTPTSDATALSTAVPALATASQPQILSEKVTPLPLTRVRRAGGDQPTVLEDDDGEDDSDVEAEQAKLQANRRIEDAPPRPADAEHPSLGSAAHTEGQCKRCCFYPRGRCLNGYECDFCHYEHEKRKRKNKKKKKKDPTSSAANGCTEEKAVVAAGCEAPRTITLAAATAGTGTTVISAVPGTSPPGTLPVSSWDSQGNSVVYMPSTSQPASGTILSTVGPPPAFPYPYAYTATLPQPSSLLSSQCMTLASGLPATATWPSTSSTVSTAASTTIAAAAPPPAVSVAYSSGDGAPPPPLQSPKLVSVSAILAPPPPSNDGAKVILASSQPPPPMESPKLLQKLEITPAPPQAPLQSPKICPVVQ